MGGQGGDLALDDGGGQDGHHVRREPVCVCVCVCVRARAPGLGARGGDCAASPPPSQEPPPPLNLPSLPTHPPHPTPTHPF